jgi:hypothetical protein
MSPRERYAAIVAEHGRCTCPSEICIGEDGGDGPPCGFCAAIDPEWPCPHEPDGMAVYRDLIAGAPS